MAWDDTSRYMFHMTTFSDSGSNENLCIILRLSVGFNATLLDVGRRGTDIFLLVSHQASLLIDGSRLVENSLVGRVAASVVVASAAASRADKGAPEKDDSSAHNHAEDASGNTSSNSDGNGEQDVRDDVPHEVGPCCS
jgi:hypothetical protein